MEQERRSSQNLFFGRVGLEVIEGVKTKYNQAAVTEIANIYRDKYVALGELPSSVTASDVRGFVKAFKHRNYTALPVECVNALIRMRRGATRKGDIEILTQNAHLVLNDEGDEDV